MGGVTEKIELLGKGLYEPESKIPDVLTLKQMPTLSELDYVGSDDFDQTMVDKILPASVEEKINFNLLLDIDYRWICRCLRFLNFGPYYTTSAIFCPDCGNLYGEYQVDLNTQNWIPIPEGFKNKIVLTPDSFMDFNKEVEMKLPTIGKSLSAYKDKIFALPNGRQDRTLARLCYSITRIGDQEGITPVEVKCIIEKDFTRADFIMLEGAAEEMTNFGLRAGGTVACPQCHNPNAAYMALPDEQFFRPTVRDLQQWKSDRISGKDKGTVRDKTTKV